MTTYPGAKVCTDDNEVLRMAEADGCAAELQAARASGQGGFILVAPNRLYGAFAATGDAGYTLMEFDNPLLIPIVLAGLLMAAGQAGFPFHSGPLH